MAIVYMLDTNTASFFIKNNKPSVDKQMQRFFNQVCISAITESEFLYGLAKKPEAKKLHKVVNDFLSMVKILPFDFKAAKSYAELRSNCENEGIVISCMDLLISAHSMSIGAILVSNDGGIQNAKAFLQQEDWTQNINAH